MLFMILFAVTAFLLVLSTVANVAYYKTISRINALLTSSVTDAFEDIFKGVGGFEL